MTAQTHNEPVSSTACSLISCSREAERNVLTALDAVTVRSDGKLSMLTSGRVVLLSAPLSSWVLPSSQVTCKMLFVAHSFVLLQRTGPWILINHPINVDFQDVRDKKVSLAVSCSSAKIP